MVKIKDLNTSYLFFKKISNIEVCDNKEKPTLKDAFSITENNSDMYIIYMDTQNNIGIHHMKDNVKNSQLDRIVLILSLLLSNNETLSFKQIKDIFKTYILKYILYQCSINDLKRLIDTDKY